MARELWSPVGTAADLRDEVGCAKGERDRWKGGNHKLCLTMIDSLIAIDIGVYISNHRGSRSTVKNE